MGHLHPVKQDDVFQLGGIAYHGPFPHQGVPPDKRAVAYLGPGADNDGFPHEGGGRQHGCLMDPDAGAGRRVLLLGKGGT